MLSEKEDIQGDFRYLEIYTKRAVSMDVNGCVGSSFYLWEDRVQIRPGVNDCLVKSLRLWSCLETTGEIRDMKRFTCFSSL